MSNNYAMAEPIVSADVVAIDEDCAALEEIGAVAEVGSTQEENCRRRRIRIPQLVVEGSLVRTEDDVADGIDAAAPENDTPGSAVEEREVPLGNTDVVYRNTHEEEQRNSNNVQARPLIQLVDQETVEVEPEVDIESVHVPADQSMDTISGITVSAVAELTESTVAQLEDGSNMWQHSNTIPPPPMPHRAVFARRSPQEVARHVSNSTGSTPDYKAQVNSRSVIGAAVVEDDTDEDDSVADAAVARAVTAVAVSDDEDNDSSEQLKATGGAVLPTHSNSARYERGQESDSSGSDSNIPVVHALLVPEERLEAEERTSGARPRESSSNASPGSSQGESTLPTHSSSGGGADRNSNTSRSKSTSKDTPAPRSERSFWITVIVVAMLLNSLLVAGIVVGGFCAAGKCSKDTKPKRNSSQNIRPVDASFPTPAPSVHGRDLSAHPTDIGILVDRMPGAPSISPGPSVSFGDTESSTFDGPQAIFDPPSAAPIPNSIGTVVSTPPPMPESDQDEPSFPPRPLSSMPIADGGDSEDDGEGENSAIKLLILLLSAAVLEAGIVASLYLYYRRWKLQRKRYDQAALHPSECTEFSEQVPEDHECC